MPAFRWDQPVADLPGIGPKRAEQLASAGITTLGQLMSWVPYTYRDAQSVVPLDQLEAGQWVTIEATVRNLSKHRTKQNVPYARVQIEALDNPSQKLTMFFFRQPYLQSHLKKGQSYAFTGKTGAFGSSVTLTNPTFEPLDQDVHIHTGRVLPVYSVLSDLKTTWLRRLMHQALEYGIELPTEYLPEEAIADHGLLHREQAWRAVHFPETLDQARDARRRLAMDELWSILLTYRQQRESEKAFHARLSLTADQLAAFRAQFAQHQPFPPTESQARAFAELDGLLQSSYPQHQIVQGEVGSGKTLVAAYALLAMALHGGQSLYLAPTTILAKQHWTFLQEIARPFGISVALWTAESKDSPDADILVGTHALLSKTGNFAPCLLVVDEEHRFGVGQREHYWSGQQRPHVLSMTATPIPRTLARVLYGDQCVSFLEPIPSKVRRTTTRVVPASKLAAHLSWLDTEILDRTPAFLIAPLIGPSTAEDFEDVMSAQQLFTLAKKALPQRRVGLLTGKTTTAEKNELLAAMRDGQLDVLVATPVIEVGIDIPQASVITITSAERFGLAQLHQLRGRVGRAGQESWCFLIPTGGTGNDRLKALEKLHNGHELAELDLANRGIGDFLGNRQSGWENLDTGLWWDLELLKTTKELFDRYA